MISEELTEFSRDFHEQIRAEAHAIGALREQAYIQKMGDILEDYGEIEALDPCSYQSTGVKVDGYCYDDEFKSFTLVVSHFLDQEDPTQARVSNGDVQREFKRITKFLERSLKEGASRIEVSNEAHGLASLIYDCRQDITTVKLVLITDGVTQKEPATIEEISGVEVSSTVWDIERTCSYWRTGIRDEINIEFADYCNGPLPCIVQEDSDSRYTTYLGFIPGTALADMYARHGIRMLDMNVRVFLSARGNVNKGIRRTIIDEPDMFCAYNNGITVFARSVETVPMNVAAGLLKAIDFQIVNGGQTTASLYHTRKKDRADLQKVSVPMKLAVIHQESDVATLVPRISLFSNTQNKVQLADLAANEAPHPEIQAISNSVLAPDPTGGSVQTYWFYERARGSYEESRNMTAKTPAQKRSFDELRPKSQKFDKIKFAKAWNAYLRLPHVVSLGGQKNFVRFNEWLREQKEENWVAFFKKTVALLILWNAMEKMVRRQKFDGYHHNIVAYTLAWLFHQSESRIDLDKIWQKQAAGEPVLDALEAMSHTVDQHIRDTTLNITEYCKKQECWERLKAKEYVLPSEIAGEYVTGDKGTAYSTDLQSEKEAIAFCTNTGSQSWFELARWLKERNFLAPKARSQCFNMGRKLGRDEKPSPVLSVACKKIWEESEVRGWNPSAGQ